MSSTPTRRDVPSPPGGDPEAHADRACIQRIQQGSEAALAELYQRHGSLMLGVATRILGSRADAEDLVHDVFVEAWQRASHYDAARGSVRSWLLMRARSRALDRLRSLAVVRRHASEVAAEPKPEPAEPSEHPDRARARRALESLPESQRAVLELAYFGGLSASEIAARLQAPTSTIKSRAAAGLRQLRQLLQVEAPA
ncbi:MAG: sigma-70 family RNA polymerase sigma factor [Myxococcota bacterium]|nr:sigma-70 family RNA polymerase sigma factor [Myxococcota bacterium]